MSTIAITDLGIAFDTLIVWGEQKDLAAFPKVFMSKNSIFAVAGEMGPARHLAANYEHVDDIRDVIDDMPDEVDFELVVINSDFIASKQVISYTKANPYGDILRIPHFMGSGAPYARGAFLGGTTASAAVTIAAQCDPSTGGVVHYFDFERTLQTMEELSNDHDLYDLHGQLLARPR